MTTSTMIVLFICCFLSPMMTMFITCNAKKNKENKNK